MKKRTLTGWIPGNWRTRDVTRIEGYWFFGINDSCCSTVIMSRVICNKKIARRFYKCKSSSLKKIKITVEEI